MAGAVKRTRHDGPRAIGPASGLATDLASRLRKTGRPIRIGLVGSGEMGTDIVGFQHYGGFKQKLGLVVHVKAHSDLRQKPHAFDMVPLSLQVVAAQLFRFVHFAFLDQAGNGQ